MSMQSFWKALFRHGNDNASREPSSAAATTQQNALGLERLEDRTLLAFDSVIVLNQLGDGGYTLSGSQGDEVAGYSVSGAGDVNGDGLDDIIIGAPGADVTPTATAANEIVVTACSASEVSALAPPSVIGGAGKSYVIFGREQGLAGAQIDLGNLGTSGFTISGYQHDGGAGTSVSGAGDVNGDGFDDVIIGAPFMDVGCGGVDAGRAFVVFGSTSLAGQEIELILLGSGGFVLEGAAEDDFAGFSVSGAGDVNGDGFDDVIVGAPRSSVNGYESGQSYVVFGSAALGGAIVELGDLPNTMLGLTIDGFQAEARSGFSVSGAGDVNGDGFDDVIVGAPGTAITGANSGQSYVIFGHGSGLPGATIDAANIGANGFVINGFEAEATSGLSVSGAGDLNGDGFDDLIIGAPYSGVSGAESGQSFVVFGSAGLGGAVLTLNQLGLGGLTINGAAAGDLSGFSVGAAGDVNGDGYDDLVIGAPHGSDGGAYAGQEFVIFGRPVGLRGATISLASLAAGGVTLNGFQIDGHVGWSGYSAGDVNGDGVDDLIVGAPFASVTGPESGQAYVLFGESADSDEGFVRSLYRDLLFREADPQGLAGWLALLEGGASRELVARSIYESAEQRGLEVDRLYLSILHRNPTESERASWVGAFLSGMTTEQVITSFLSSNEFLERNPPIEQYVATLYAGLLQRYPSAEELQAWREFFQGHAVDEVAAGFLDSPEFHQNFLAQIYHQYLHRRLDSTGAAGWGELLDSGAIDFDDLVVDLLASDEYFADSGSHF